MTPRITIVTAAFNSESFISRTIESALNQTYEDFEMLIVDDGSSDKTSQVISSFQDDRITLYREANRGPSAARNLAIERSRGAFIALLDHDDLWFPPRLQSLIEYLENHNHVGFVSSNMLSGNPDNPSEAFPVLANPGCPENDLSRAETWARHCGFSSSTAVIRKELFERHGLFDESLWYAQDWDLTLRFWLEGEIPFMVPEILGWTLVRRGQLSSNVWGMFDDREKVLRKALEHTSARQGFPAAAVRELGRVKRARVMLGAKYAYTDLPRHPVRAMKYAGKAAREAFDAFKWFTRLEGKRS